jgi:hypothetical protein
MSRGIISLFVALCLVCVPVSGSNEVAADTATKPGLVGAWYSRKDFRNIKQIELIHTLELTSETDDGAALRGDRGKGWSAQWIGFILAPVSGEITFCAKTPEGAVLEIGGKGVLELKRGQNEGCGPVRMEEGQAYPIKVAYIHGGGKADGTLSIRWSWAGSEMGSIPAANLYHQARQAGAIEDQLNKPLGDEPGASAPLTVPVENVIVYHEPGRFAAWPANGGAWNWGDEILVGLLLGHFKPSRTGHAYDHGKGFKHVLSRSPDGGKTWALEDPENYIGDGGEITSCPGGINFADPDFAMKCAWSIFLVSYDRGKTWRGPYRLPDLGKPLSARTDYIVNGPGDCLFFLSARDERVESTLQDRALCAHTVNGGKTIEFVSWITHNRPVRSVMPSTVRISDNHLVTAMRRRRDDPVLGRDKQKNWIDCSVSHDNGKTWTFLSKVADTDTGKRNGNPPSMVRLEDGRLCVTYGYRATPYGIRAKLSSDNGKTWGQEIALRLDGRNFDLGYTRTVQRADRRLATIYYYTTAEIPEQHIAATIWNPNLVCKRTETK